LLDWEHYRGFVEKLSLDASRKHANWDDYVFKQFAMMPGAQLWQALGPRSGAQAILSSYLLMVSEAIAAGYIREMNWGRPCRSFMEYYIRELVPAAAAQNPPKTALMFLAEGWNIAEGLQNQPRWIDGFVASQTRELKCLDQVKTSVAAAIDKALSTPDCAAWTGNSRLYVLKPRDLIDDFLPGDMHLAAPIVVCVHDRRQHGSHVQVYLDKAGQSALAGPFPCAGNSQPAALAPATKISQNEVEIQGRLYQLPLIGTAFSELLTESGFYLASAEDSQRLWLLECE